MLPRALVHFRVQFLLFRLPRRSGLAQCLFGGEQFRAHIGDLCMQRFDLRDAGGAGAARDGIVSGESKETSRRGMGERRGEAAHDEVG